MLEKVRKKLNTAGLFVIKWRYLIALVVFIFCVAFKLHGSSISEYNKLFTDAESYNSESLILGESRAVRSDEWLVHTPYYISQVYNDFNKTSNMMSLEGQDMIIGYNAPVLDITILGKPFTWGYVLFGSEYGLSWYWCSKLILLILVTFELCMIITQKNKKLSVFGALLISFSPMVQWWFVPHMVDVIFWGITLFVLAYHFFTSVGWKRSLMTVLLPLSVVTFVLALFPSLQIAIGLLMIALLIAVLIRDKKQITFKKKDIWRICVMAAYAIGVLAYTLITSKDAILTLYNTAYPGKRVALGGDLGIESLFTNLVSFTLPFKDITYSNNCEVSNFIHFAPIFLILYPTILKKCKKDKNIIVGNVFVVALIIMTVFMTVGFPWLLAKVTLFSYINRMDIVYGFAATLFTIWGVSIIWNNKNLFSKKQILIVLAVYIVLYVCFITKESLTYLAWWQYAIIIAGLAVLAWLMLKKKQNLFIVGVTALVLISGATVNPLAHGMSPLFAHPLEEKIHEIAETDSDAYWLATGSIILPSLCIANGAKTLNATNFYPDFAKWQLIDEDGASQDIYNRYAHMLIMLTTEETKFAYGSTPDSLVLYLNYEDSLKWPVKYLLVDGTLDEDQQIYSEIYSDTESNYHIYERTKW